MLFGKLWLRIKGELLLARNRISAENDTLKKPEELFNESKKRLKEYLPDSAIQGGSRPTVHDPATDAGPEVTEEPKTASEDQTSAHDPQASNPRTLG
jgi:hypothetical protein